jgi:hypothetical protein
MLIDIVRRLTISRSNCSCVHPVADAAGNVRDEQRGRRQMSAASPAGSQLRVLCCLFMVAPTA